MSGEKVSTGQDIEGAVLEGNVERLLRAASGGPKISDEARSRVLANLLKRQALGVSSEAEPRPEAPPAARPEAQAPKKAEVASIAKAKPRLSAGRAAAIAGVLALAAGAALWFRPTSPTEASLVYPNPGPQPREIILRDGSHVVLDAGTVLLERAPRQVMLVRGQAIFDVATQTAQFLVETNQGKASALGTRFWLKAGDTESEVAVAKGRVELASSRGDKQIVRAGEEGILRGDAPPKASAAPRVSHFFDFARKTEAEQLTSAPRRKGTLTARDPRWGGHEEPLALRSFDIDVHVEDGFAQTTIDQTYFNPRSRQLEGTYAFPLPEGAALSRLAMYVDGKRMEGAMVERSRGRDIYEGIVEMRRDPALLEWMSGNTFRMRVFPLPGRTEKRLFMSYTQPLEHLYESDRLVVPIPSVDQAADHARFTVRVVGGASKSISSPSHDVKIRDDGADTLVTFEAEHYSLGQDLVLSLKDPGTGSDSARSFVEGADRYVMVRHAPDVRTLAGTTEAAKPRKIAILFDVSASRTAEDLEAQSRFVDGLLDSFDDDDQVSIVTVGYDAEVMGGGAEKASIIDRTKVGSFLSARAEGLGDSRLELGIDKALSELGTSDGAEHEIFYVGDGVDVVADQPFSAAGRRASDLATRIGGKAHFIGVGMGDSIDRGLLDAVAEETGGLAITVGEDEDLRHRAFDLVASTYTPCVRGIEAEVLDENGKKIEKATVVPTSRHACDGERIDVIARAPKGGAAPAQVEIRGQIGQTAWKKTISLSGTKDDAAYLPRVFAERRVHDLLAADPPTAGVAESAYEAEITELAKRYFLVTPFTSLLVLENDEMYRHFKVEKKEPTGWAVYQAPAEIPVHSERISASALAGSWQTLERSPVDLFYTYPGATDGIDLGSIGTIGFAEGGLGRRGFGSGTGRLGGRHMGPARVDPSAATITTNELAEDDVQTRTVASASAATPMAVPDMPAGRAPVGAKSAELRQRLEYKREQRNERLRASAESGWIDQAMTNTSLRTFASRWDSNLDDVTMFVPSMFPLEVDRIADYVAATQTDEARIEPRAKEMLERALEAAPRGSFETRRGDKLVVGKGSSITLDRALPTKLRERAVLDGSKLSFEYEELGLRTTRNVGSAEAWWLASEVPWVAPTLDSLRGLSVKAVGPSSIRIGLDSEASDEEIQAIVLSFDDSGRIAKVVVGDDPATTIAYEGSRVIVSSGDGAPAVTFESSSASLAASSAGLVDVEMPLSNPNRYKEILDAAPLGPGAAHAERQLLATYAALLNTAELEKHLLALEKIEGKLTRGDVALASRAFTQQPALRKKLSSLLSKNDPMREYLQASMSESSEPLIKVGDAHEGTLFGLLGSYRSLLADMDKPAPSKTVLARVRSLHSRYADATFFRYAAVRLTAEHVRWRDDALALSLWDTLAGHPTLGVLADLEAVGVLRSSKPKEAAERAERVFDAAITQGLPLQLDWEMRYAITSARGEVGLDVLMARWRRALIEKGSARQLLGYVRSVLMFRGQGEDFSNDVGPLLRRLDSAPDTDVSSRLSFSRLLLSAHRVPEAKQALEPLLSGSDIDPRALELSAAISEEEGNLDRSAAMLDRLLRTTANEPLDLQVVRTWYSRLVGLHMRRAGLAGSYANAAIQDAVGVANRWRREDPGNASIDEACATALFRIGQTTEAKRHLFSIVERRPAEGGSWAKVATILERQGDLDAALVTWKKATIVEPTNPTWLLSHAQSLLARGTAADRREANTMLEKIKNGKWQDRFTNVVYNATTLLDQKR